MRSSEETTGQQKLRDPLIPTPRPYLRQRPSLHLTSARPGHSVPSLLVPLLASHPGQRRRRGKLASRSVALVLALALTFLASCVLLGDSPAGFVVPSLLDGGGGVLRRLAKRLLSSLTDSPLRKKLFSRVKQ